MNAPATATEAPAMTLTPEMLRALAELHDLQLAEGAEPALWPWLFAAVILAGAALLAWAWWRRPQRRGRRRLAQIESSYRARRAASPAAADAGPALVAAIASLLRAAATDSRRRPPMPPGLAGDDWLRWLDRQAPAADRGAFVSGVGRELLHWPYAPPAAGTGAAALDPTRADALLALTARWLRAEG
jgi:hypothetical protein